MEKSARTEARGFIDEAKSSDAKGVCLLDEANSCEVEAWGSSIESKKLHGRG
jgi:hypothetical protein